jgi:thymidylate synthase (FAD)
MNREISLISEITVRLIQSMGGDHMVVAAAKVSTNGEDALRYADPEQAEANAGLINYLVNMRHGTPFEHSALTFFVHAPIFVWREWHRHRIGFSYNEESARYKQLEPVFYVPPRDRPMVKIDGWKPGRPRFRTLDEAAREMAGMQDTALYPTGPKDFADAWHLRIVGRLEDAYKAAYSAYEENILDGIDPGLARDCLPVGIYSSCWVTCNPRSLMAFLALRMHDPDARHVSYPLYEIEVAARMAERFLSEGWPLTYAAFVKAGRVAP